MDGIFIETKNQKISDNSQKENITTYEYEGYQIRIHFSDDKTLMQCMKNLLKRKIKTESLT